MNTLQCQSLEVLGIPPVTGEMMDGLMQHAQRQNEIARELLTAQPGLGFITAYTMAGDFVSAETMTEQVKAGKLAASRAVNLIGSYARFQWAVENLDRRELFRCLPELWTGSDPDDTNLEYLELWRGAARIKKGPVLDGKHLPRRRAFTAYRGQRPQDPIGFSWTLDKRIAQKFASGAGMRRPIDDGTIYEAEVERGCVLAYLTGRGESELIVDIERAGLR